MVCVPCQRLTEHNLTLNNQMPLLQGILMALICQQKNILKKRPAAKVYPYPCKLTITFPDEFSNYRCSKPLLPTLIQNVIFKKVSNMMSYPSLVMGKQWPLEGTNFSLGLTLGFGRKSLSNLSHIPTKAWDKWCFMVIFIQSSVPWLPSKLDDYVLLHFGPHLKKS